MNANVGHGHVYPRPDGVRARCGGPGLCAECSQEQARKFRAEEAEAGRFEPVLVLGEE